MKLLIMTFFISSFVFLRLPIRSNSQITNSSFYYDACAPSVCGNSSVNVTFPFSSSETFCGLPDYFITCDPSSSLATINLSGRLYQVKNIYYDPEAPTLIVSDLQLVQQFRSNTCDDGLRDEFFHAANFAPFELPYFVGYLNFSWCRRDADLPPDFTNTTVDYGGCRGNESLYLLQPFGLLNNDTALPGACVHAPLPVLQASVAVLAKFTREDVRSGVKSWDNVSSAINAGFALQFDGSGLNNCSACEDDGGRCGYNQTSRQVQCFCKDICRQRGQLATNKSSSWKIILAVVVPTTFLLLAGVTAFIAFREKGSSFLRRFGKRSMSLSGNSNIKEFISNYKSMLTTQYSYAEVRKVTDGFKEKLGEGGYGNVYKGKLPNGVPVAAKVLEKSKDDGQDFVNEVATIGQIHHVNIIRLLGYCCDGSRRALIYELMSRGSLAELISNEEIRREFGARRLLDIALGIARGIEYLHNGCDKRILHLDIKPQNVLLDSNFQPKISDFGLAKLYSRKHSAVTLTGGARGTAGFIAPEVFMGGLGGVSHKSDVYSFGMLLLDMVMALMGKKNKVVVKDTEQFSDKYFPNWIYHQMQEWVGMEVDDDVVAEDDGILRKMTMVGLWCIQTDPAGRPAIGRALEMLRGEVECIPLPPQPLWFSMPNQMMGSVIFSDLPHEQPPTLLNSRERQ